REDELRAATLGINTTRYKLLAFGLSCGFAGLAGTLYAYYVLLVSPTLASPATTALVIGMAVFGGLGTIWGPAAGALLLYTINEALRFIGVVYNLIVVGLVIMTFVIFLPEGLAGLVRRRPVPGVRRMPRAGTRSADESTAIRTMLPILIPSVSSSSGGGEGRGRGACYPAADASEGRRTAPAREPHLRRDPRARDRRTRGARHRRDTSGTRAHLHGRRRVPLVLRRQVGPREDRAALADGAGRDP